MQFYLVDVFLNNKFRWFGMEVVEYYSWSFRDRQNRDLMLRWVKCQSLLLLCLYESTSRHPHTYFCMDSWESLKP